MSKPPGSQTALLAALVFVLLAVVGIAAMQGSGAPAPTAPDEAASARRVDDAELADGGFRRSDAGAPAEAATTQPVAGGERTDATIDAAGWTRPLPEDAPWAEVLVVDKVTGEPVPGAMVHWHDDSANAYIEADEDLHWTEEMLALCEHPERVASKGGWRARTDGAGKVRVTVGKEWTLVGAAVDTRYGVLDLQDNSVPPPGGYRLELAHQPSLTVRVVDHLGQPCADFPIALLAMAAGRPDAVVGFSTGPLAYSDADGRALVTRLQLECQLDTRTGTSRSWGAASESLDDDSKLVWHVRPMLPGSRAPGVAFDPAAPPTETVELRLPPTGQIHVRAEIGGVPVKSVGRASLQRVEGEVDNPTEGSRQAPADPDGMARFPRVALGERFWVYSDANGGMWKEADGPKQPGQIVDVVLQPPTDAVVVAGRLLDADRQPVPRRKLSVRARGDDLWLHATTKTDGDGRFVVNLGELEQPTLAKSLLIETLVQDGMPKRAELAGRTMRNGREELGDVVLGDAPLLVAGVVNMAGKPFAGDARVHVEHFVPPSDDDPDGSWNWLEDQYGTKDETGHFAIRSGHGPGRFRLRVTCDAALPIGPIEFAAGAADVKVELQSGARLAASVLLPPDAPVDQLRFTLVPSKPVAKVAPQRPAGIKSHDDPTTAILAAMRGSAECDDEGRATVRWSTLPPDTYTLRIELWLQGRDLLTVPGIAVPPAEQPDPRLAEIDLRAAVRIVTLRTRAADGAELEDANASVFATNQPGGAMWRAESFWDQDLALLLAPGPYELLVCTTGFRPAPVRNSAATVDLRLEPWPRVTVQVPGVPKLPEGAGVHARLVGPKLPAVPFEGTWRRGNCNDYLQPRGQDVAVEQGVARVPIGDGAHTLHIAVVTEGARTDVELPAAITVLPDQTEVAVAIPPAAWEQALARIAKEAAATTTPGPTPVPR